MLVLDESIHFVFELRTFSYLHHKSERERAHIALADYCTFFYHHRRRRRCRRQTMFI